MRTGLLAKKVGMMSFFNNNGERLAVTVLQVVDCQVIGHKTVDKHGYSALLLGCDNVKSHRVTKPMRGVFAKIDVNSKSKLKEFKVSPSNYFDIGHELKADHFDLGQLIDVTSTSIGKGFAGTIKRHNFKGLRASHGVSISHRSSGSVGGCQGGGKVFKNKKMAGHMGDKQVTVQNLQVVDIDVKRNLILVEGSVPGAKNSIVCVRDAIKQLVM